ncbi:MAG: hypothetical protein BZY80_07085 [SAR202 cluster bacterium Io17-Chloro-G2]|nr:MAG: hypothetical protein BZY80_07085 [SAR202 cluster bacterium Io17-Chloro-G2]
MEINQGDSIQGDLGYWVGSLASALRKGLDRELAALDVTSAQYAILEVCYRGEANSPSALARVIPVDTAAISRQLDKLREKGLIRRRRLTSDRRSIRVELTEEGRALVPKLLPLVHANNTRFLEGITPDEQAALSDIIQKMLRHGQDAVYSQNARAG